MRAFVAFVGAVLVAVPLVGLLFGWQSDWDRPERRGPVGLVHSDAGDLLWMLVKREERKQIATGSGSFATYFEYETRYHFELQTYDPQTAQPSWSRWLLMLRDADGGHGAEARILGQDGDVVWLFVHDQPMALSARDGQVVADGAALEARNADLRGMLSRDHDLYAFDGGLVVTTADGRHVRLRAPSFAAEPYATDDAERFRTVKFMSTRWNGGYRTTDFVIRQTMLGGRWLGLHSDREAADAGNDNYGDYLATPSKVLNEGEAVRRSLWSARITQTTRLADQRRDRLADLTRIPDTSEYLGGGFLLGAGTGAALTLADPPGLIVLHRTRIDAEGRMALTRLDQSLRPRWTATLPVAELSNRWQFPDRLLWLGAVQVTANGATQWQEHLISVDLRDGRLRSWNLTREAESTPGTN